MSAKVGNAVSSKIDINAEGWFSRNDCLQMYPEMKRFFAQFPEEYRFKVERGQISAMLPWVTTLSFDRALAEEEYLSVPHIIQIGCLTNISVDVGELLKELREDLYGGEESKGA